MSLHCIDRKTLYCYLFRMKTSHIQLRVSLHEKTVIRKAAARAGLNMSEWILSHLFLKSRVKFLSILKTLKLAGETSERPYVLHELNAFLQGLNGPQLSETVAEEHEISLPEFLDNYVAAMVEKACLNKNCQAPIWLARRTGLKTPYFGSDLASLRLFLLCNSPAPFRKRNIFIDATIGDLV